MNSVKTKNTEKQLDIENVDKTKPDNILVRYIPSVLYSINVLGEFLTLCGLYIDRIVLSVRYVRDYWEVGDSSKE